MDLSHARNKALADIAVMEKNRGDDDNAIGNCMYRFRICDNLLARVKREQDLHEKKNILQQLFNEIEECVRRCKSPFMSGTIQNLIDEYKKTTAEFNKAVDEHNARLDAEDANPPPGGSRRRNKKSKNSKKRSKKYQKTKSRRH